MVLQINLYENTEPTLKLCCCFVNILSIPHHMVYIWCNILIYRLNRKYTCFVKKIYFDPTHVSLKKVPVERNLAEVKINLL